MTVRVQVSITDTSRNGSLHLQQEAQRSPGKFADVVRGKMTERGRLREEYHLTGKDGNQQSRVMLLNGKILSLNSDPSNDFVPFLEPMYMSLADPIVVAPFSVVFARIPSMNVTACR